MVEQMPSLLQCFLVTIVIWFEYPLYSLIYLLKKKNGTRIKIAVGAARDLDYFHPYGRPLIHRDINSSSVLDAMSFLNQCFFFFFLPLLMAAYIFIFC